MSTVNGWLEARITVPTGGWVIDCTDSAGAYTVTIPAGKYTFSADDSAAVGSPFLPGIIAEFNKVGTARGISLAIGSDGLVTVNNSADPPTTITWDAGSADFKAICGFAVDVSADAQVGTLLPAALWVPDCALATSHADPGTVDTWRGTKEVNAPTTESRLGDVRTLVYGSKFSRDYGWPMVSASKTWIKSESTVGESFEQFYRNVILQEKSWATSVVCWNYDKSTGHAGNYLYRVTNPYGVAQVAEQWTGRFDVQLPRCVLLPEFNEQGIW